MQNNSAKAWVERANSSLELAKTQKANICYEDLCFQAQQSVEKALKAILIYEGLHIPRTHSIGYLFDIIENETSFKIPKKLKIAKYLTDYAVQTRYPGEYERIDIKEYKETIEIAESIINWVSSLFK